MRPLEVYEIITNFLHSHWSSDAFRFALLLAEESNLLIFAPYGTSFSLVHLWLERGIRQRYSDSLISNCLSFKLSSRAHKNSNYHLQMLEILVNIYELHIIYKGIY